MRPNDPHEAPGERGQLRHALERLARACLGFPRRLSDICDRDVHLLDGGGLLLGGEFDLACRFRCRGDKTGYLLEGGGHVAELPRSPVDRL